MDKLQEYLESISNENTKIGVTAALRNLSEYIKETKNKTIYDITRDDLDMFIKDCLKGSSSSSISSFISRIKGVLYAINKKRLADDLSLNYIKDLIAVKRTKVFTPKEIFEAIDELLNYQDKALVLLVYMGLYDNEFNTIRNIKIEDIKDGYLTIGDEKIRLNSYCDYIFSMAINETALEKYMFGNENSNLFYSVNVNSPYLIRGKYRKGCNNKVSVATLKKKFFVYAKWIGEEDFTPVAVKNSRIIYDIVKEEYEKNDGLEINQVELKAMLKANNIKGTIEQLNIDKKKVRNKIIKEIVNGETSFIDKED